MDLNGGSEGHSQVPEPRDFCSVLSVSVRGPQSCHRAQAQLLQTTALLQLLVLLSCPHEVLLWSVWVPKIRWCPVLLMTIQLILFLGASFVAEACEFVFLSLSPP